MGPTTSHNLPLSFLCCYTIVFKIGYNADLGEGPGPPLIFRPNWGPKGPKKRLLETGHPPLSQGLDDRPPPPLTEGLDPPLGYLIGHLGDRGKSKGSWGQTLPPSPIWPMLRVVTDETDKIRQRKFFSALVALSLWSGYLIAFVRKHPKLSYPVVQSNKFSRHRGRLPISGPHWFYRGHFGYLITSKAWCSCGTKQQNFLGIVSDCRLASPTDFIRGISFEKLDSFLLHMA